jgi:hypothetical protein
MGLHNNVMIMLYFIGSFCQNFKCLFLINRENNKKEFEEISKKRLYQKIQLVMLLLYFDS